MKRKCFLGFALTSILQILLIFSGVSDSKSTPELVTKEVDVLNRAVDWLTSQRQEDFGWSDETARVVAAFAAASVEDWPSKEDLEASLSTKQLEIELLERLLRNDTDPISPVRLAVYSLALNSICRDSQDFHGYNLIETLAKHHVDEDYPGYPQAFGYGLSSLVTCLSDGHIRKHQVRHLVQILRDKSGEHTIDTRSFSLMALECVRRRRHSEMLGLHIQEGVESLAQAQKPDGSFGNTYSTALAIQGLATASPSRFWNRTNALFVLSSKQERNGSFGNDIHATTDVVLAMSALLNGSGLLKLKRNRCKSFTYHPPGLDMEAWNFTTTPKSSQPNNTPTQINTILMNSTVKDLPKNEVSIATTQHEIQIETTSELTGNSEVTTADTSSPFPTTTNSQGSDIVVKYWLWIGNDPLIAEKRNLTVHIPVNSTFFQLMLQAAQISEAYEFSSTLWPNGHYIHTVSGQAEQPVMYHYWLLYHLPADPDPNNPPPTTYIAPGGVDDLIVHDGEIYMFWFKKI